MRDVLHSFIQRLATIHVASCVTQWVVAIVALFAASVAASQKVETTLRVYLNGLHDAPIQVAYYLSGSFGGIGSSGELPVSKGRIELPTTVDGQPARSLKALIFCSGYRTVWLDVSNPDASPDLAVELDPLPLRIVSGVVEFAEGAAPASFYLDVAVVVFSANSFFGVADGMAPQFAVAGTVVDESDYFSMQLPDLTSDARLELTSAYLLTARKSPTGNFLFDVTPNRLSIEDIFGRIQHLTTQARNAGN